MDYIIFKNRFKRNKVELSSFRVLLKRKKKFIQNLFNCSHNIMFQKKKKNLVNLNFLTFNWRRDFFYFDEINIIGGGCCVTL